MQPPDSSNSQLEDSQAPAAAPKPVDGMQPIGASSSRKLHPSPGFNPNPPQSEAVKAHLATSPPPPPSEPVSPPPPPLPNPPSFPSSNVMPGLPSEPSDSLGNSTPVPRVAQTAAAAGPSEYHSNPFALTLHGLGRIFEINGTSGLLLSFVLVLIWLVFPLVAFTGAAATAVSGGAATGSLLLLVVFIVLTLLDIALIGSLYELITASMEGRAASTRQMLGRGFAKFLPMLGLGILLAIILTVGFVLFLLPGLFLFGRLGLAPYSVMAENLGPIASLKRSFALSKGHVFEIYGALFASATLAGYGLLLPMVSVAGLGTRYEELKQLKDSDATKPPTHWLNFLVPVVALVFIGGFVGLAVWSAHHSPKTTTQSSFQTQYYGGGSGSSTTNFSNSTSTGTNQ